MDRQTLVLDDNKTVQTVHIKCQTNSNIDHKLSLNLLLTLLLILPLTLAVCPNGWLSDWWA